MMGMQKDFLVWESCQSLELGLAAYAERFDFVVGETGIPVDTLVKVVVGFRRQA